MIDALAERNTREFSFETCVTSSKAEDPKPLYPGKLLTFGRHLPTVEMAARGITGIGRHGLSIMTDLTLPDFGKPTKLAWPPPTVPLAVQVATSAIHRPHPGAKWWQVAEEYGRHQPAISCYLGSIVISTAASRPRSLRSSA